MTTPPQRPAPRHSHRRRTRPGAASLLLALAASAAAAAPVPAATSDALAVTIPLRLDTVLLQRLLERQLFTGAAGTHDLLGATGGCSTITLSEPSLTPEGSQLVLLAGVKARLGVGTADACRPLLSWQGRLGLAGTPVPRDAGTAIGFEPARTWLLDREGERLPAGHQLQQLAEAGASSFFSRYHVDLRPQLDALQGLLPAVLPSQSRTQIETLLDGLRLTALEVDSSGITAAVQVALEPATEPAGEPPPTSPLSPEEIATWQARWQQMDALLVLAVKHYAAATGLQPLREALLDVLIESRYRLDDMLASTAQGDADPVRAWFLDSWQSLAPVLRQIALEQPGEELLLLLSALAATDALAALDELGPSIGLDISTDGLRRLARLVSGREGDSLLRYSGELDPALERIFRDVLAAPVPTGWRLDLSPFPRAVASPADRLNRWAPKREDLADYLPQVAALLEASTRATLADRDLEPAHRELFRHLVLATAWQESCWRHYVVSDDRKLVPLRSGTGDVGLMQINERVWRGFYDQQRLRWDIAYNGSAGTEVLLDYLLRYALRKGEHRQPGGTSNLARAAYAAYNGGPSRLTRYRDDSASTYGKKVDRAFWEKYRAVSAGNELAVSQCLGGNLTGRAVARPGDGDRGPSASGGGAPGAFTLQLGAFGTRAAASRFIDQHRLPGSPRLQRRSRNGETQYLVLYGSYQTRAAAEAARGELAGLDAWVRPEQDPKATVGD